MARMQRVVSAQSWLLQPSVMRTLIFTGSAAASTTGNSSRSASFRHRFMARTSELQVLYREAVVDELLQGIDADAQVHRDVLVVDVLVALGGLHALGRHRLVGNQQQGAGGNLVGEAGGEDRG